MARRLIIIGMTLALAGPGWAAARADDPAVPGAPGKGGAKATPPTGKAPKGTPKAPAAPKSPDGDVPSLADTPLGDEPANPPAAAAPAAPPDQEQPAPPAGISEAPPLPAPPAQAEPAPKDDVRQAGAEAASTATAPQPAGDMLDAEHAFILKPEQLGPSPQTASVTVEVQAPPTVNLDLPVWIKLLVRNTGGAEAAGVKVYYPIPDGIEFVSSQPELKPSGPLLTWAVGGLPAGGTRELRVRVKPTKVQLLDHTATVTMMAGARAKMVVKQPKLKVELMASPAKVLKGGQVKFSVTVANPGTGVAHNVAVQAKLSPGLKHKEGTNTIEMDVGSIGPGQTVPLDELFVDADAGGDQTCEVSVSSPDVAKDTDEAHASKSVSVVEPKLKLTLAGHDKRITNTVGTYRITVENPGTAPARHVRLSTYLPLGGRLYVPKGASFDSAKRVLSWPALLQLDPGEKRTFDFKVLMGGVGRYQVDADVRADGALSDKGSLATHVTALAYVNFDVTERTQALDVGEETEFEVRVRNSGSKDATKLLISAKISDNLEFVRTSGTDKPAERDPKDPTTLLFPTIDRLAPKGDLPLTIVVKATKPGVANCKVSLMHDDLGNVPMNRDTPVTIMEPRR